jgi:hypothetical protein
VPQQSAQPKATDKLDRRCVTRWRIGVRQRPVAHRLVRPLLIELGDVLGQQVPPMPFPEHGKVVEALLLNALSPSLGVGVHVRPIRTQALRLNTVDGVPWNNNNAENAIRQFAYYRDDTPGRLKEPGLRDYLVLLSLYQTCRYKGVSFLKFLLSRERDMTAFCLGRRRKRRPPLIEVYPKGVRRPDFRPSPDQIGGPPTPDQPPNRVEG